MADSATFPRVAGLLVDLDGVVYTGAQPIPGAARFLAEARRRGFPFLLVTNNSTSTPRTVCARLAGMEIHVQPADVLTSGQAAAAHISQRQPGARVLVVGESGLREAVAEVGLQVVEDGSTADCVLAGLDRQFSYARLTSAVQAVLGGAWFVASNADPLLPVEGGAMLPGAGSIVAAIATATGTPPEVVGKPEPALFQAGVQRLGSLSADQVAMVGDRIDTDIEGGRRAGLRTILVLSGIATARDAATLAPPPDAVVQDLAAVASLLDW